LRAAHNWTPSSDFFSAPMRIIIFLQEADRNAGRTSYRNVAREIAQNLKLNYVFGSEFEELAQGPRESSAYHGQATLSRWPLSDSSILRFHNQSNFWQPHWFIARLPPTAEETRSLRGHPNPAI
jgi:hypothetical protein